MLLCPQWRQYWAKDPRTDLHGCRRHELNLVAVTPWSMARKQTTVREPKATPARTPRGDATRQTILDAALCLFSEKGYHQTTVPDIVTAAGVGHGTFYEYFSNRRDVLIALTAIAAKNL